MSPAATSAEDGRRCFLALLPDAAGRDALLASQAPVASNGSPARGLRWVDAASLHLTLRFLGNTTPGQVEYLAYMLPTLAAALPPLQPRRCAIWPNRARPRMLVLELAACAELSALARACESLARNAGFEAEPRAFRPHVTLARLRPGFTPGSMPSLPPAIGFASMALEASDPRGMGPRYRTLAEVPLPGAG